MFPQPGARPPKRNVALTVLVSVAIAVVLALVIGLAFGRTSSTTTVAAQPAPTSAPSAVATVDTGPMWNALPTADRFGPLWRITERSDLAPDQLTWNEPCWSAPGLESVAQGGAFIDHALAPEDAGNNRGEAEVWVKQYATTADVDGQLTARADPQFGACAAQFARDDLECSCLQKTATDSQLTPLAAPAGVRAAVYRTELHYLDGQGHPQPFSEIRAYVGVGRWLGSLRVYEIDAPVDETWFDQQLTAYAQQLALRAPH